MSNRYMDLVKGARPFGHASRRTVMLILAEHADAHGRCWPSVRLLELETELSKRTLLRCLSDLKDVGRIAVEKRSIGLNLKCNQYVVSLKKLVGYQRPGRGVMVTPEEGKDESFEAEVSGATVTPDEYVSGVMVTPEERTSGATATHSGAMVTPDQVPKATFSGAKTASLYRTPINPHRNPQGGTEEESKTPPSIRPRSESLDESASDCAKVFFDRIGVVAPKSTLDLAAGVIEILARESDATPRAAMLKLEDIAKAAQMRGTVINQFWFADSKWRGTEARNAFRPDPAIGMRKVHDILAPRAEEEQIPAGVDTELARSVWEGMKKEIKAQIGPGSFETWVRPIKPLGVMNGELYLQIPNADFAHVPGRYEISNYLPPTMSSTIHVTTAREYGAA
jgi:DnaA N-terminal domain/Helix-turn-helix domain